MNTTVDVYVENITVTGFDLVFHAWTNTRAFNIRAVWYASGEC
jgi:hypothetical protein